MAIFRQNFSKPRGTTRAIKRDRRRARKSKARQTSGTKYPQESATLGNLPTNIRFY